MDIIESPNQVIVKILEIVGFQGDKNAFVDQFNEVFHAAVLIKLLESLSEDKRNEFQKQVDGKLDPEKFQSLIKEYFSEQQIAQANEKAMAETIADFLESIDPDVPEEKKAELDKYLESILPTKEK